MENLTRQVFHIRTQRFLSVQTGGNPDGDLILMIHGAGGRGDQWRCQAPVLAEDYSLVVPDLLGHGNSAIPDRGYTFPELAADIDEVFLRYRTGRNIVFGHSYGAALALWLAGKYPGLITKLVLIGAAPFRPQRNYSIWLLPAAVLEFLRPLMSRKFAAGAFHPDTDPEFIRRERALSDNNPMPMMRALFRGMSLDGAEDLSRVAAETLIINGAGDRFTPPPPGRELAQSLSRATFLEIPRGSHMVMMERPQEVNRHILEFLARKVTPGTGTESAGL